MRREEKEEKVATIRERFAESNFCFLIDYKGLDVDERDAFKEELLSHESDCMVVKNTLADIALEDYELDGFREALEGPSMFVYGESDIGSSAQAIEELQKEYPDEANTGTVKAIWFQEQVYGPEEFERFAGMLSEEEAKSKLLGMMKGSARKFVSLLDQIKSRLPRLLSQKADEGEDE